MNQKQATHVYLRIVCVCWLYSLSPGGKKMLANQLNMQLTDKHGVNRGAGQPPHNMTNIEPLGL